MLIELGADHSIKNNVSIFKAKRITHTNYAFVQEGDTPLHIAAFAEKSEMIKLLLDYGADKSIKNNVRANTHKQGQ
jgi:ankyrin repeat protein